MNLVDFCDVLEGVVGNARRSLKQANQIIKNLPKGTSDAEIEDLEVKESLLKMTIANLEEAITQLSY